MSSNSSTDCPFCGIPSTILVLDETVFHRCAACGFLWKDHSHHLSAAAERKRYDLHDPVPDDAYVKVLRHDLELAVSLAPSATALDFGCGRSRAVSTILAEAGFTVDRYDLHYESDVSVLSRRYGLVAAVEVVEHFRHPEDDWRQLSRLLLPGGVIAVTTSMVPTHFNDWWYRRDSTHYCFYTPATFRTIAVVFGLSVVFTDGIRQIVMKGV
jgi:SAM-dependent methyltransferase